MDPSREKSTKNRDDPNAGTSQHRKAQKKTILIKRPIPVADISDDELGMPLEIDELIERGTRNQLNFSKTDFATITAKRQEECYTSRKTVIDLRFWMLFHADWYMSIYLQKRKPVVESQWLNWEYMKSKKNTYFDKIIEATKRHDLIGTFEFQYSWNKEGIAQFYSTLLFQKDNRTL
jgi:hypothetical protein